MTPFPQTACVVDFETAGIKAYPDYPPAPCGVAIRWESGITEYLAWGHAEGNNCTFDAARRAVARAYKFPCFFHNAAFDMEVARVHMGLPYPREWHDTMFMAFLCDPHAPSLALKALGEYTLGIKPAEKDALVEYGMKELGLKKSEVMANVPLLPVKIVGPYAEKDTHLTYKLAERYWDEINIREMWAAYVREKALAPWLIDNERRGVRVDRQLLTDWQTGLAGGMDRCDARLRLKLGDVNFDANEELADALEKTGFVHPEHWARTETGVRSVAMPVLVKLLPPDLFSLIAYRNKAATMLRTFLGPWLEKSGADGRLHTGWSQVRNPEGNGTRTGRIASFNPNLANIPNEQKIVLPDGLYPLPVLRRALLPEEGHLWMSADYSQQELRLLAHFEDGDLMRAYQANPRLDLHAYVADLVLRRTGITMDRKTAKILGFSIIYGAGSYKIADQLGVSTNEAMEFRSAYLAALPGVDDMRNEATGRFNRNKFVRTLGGRVYYTEPPKKGRSFAYKALNVLIQGSAADQTKEAIIKFCGHTPYALFLGQCYDEVNVSVPEECVLEGAVALDHAMTTALPIDVPVTTDIEVGPNWGEMTPLELPHA